MRRRLVSWLSAAVGTGVPAALTLGLLAGVTAPVPAVIVEFDWARAVVIAAVVAAIPALVAVLSAVRRPDPAARLRAVEEA